MLVCPHELRGLDGVVRHRGLQICLRRRSEVGKPRVERDEPEEVAVSPYRRTRTAVARALPIVPSLARARREVDGLDTFGESFRVSRQVVEHPVCENALR